MTVENACLTNYPWAYLDRLLDGVPLDTTNCRLRACANRYISPDRYPVTALQEASTMASTKPVTLREISAATVRQITDLTVAPEQQRFVASNAVSLAEALFTPEAWYRAIYAGELPAGFVMLYDESLRDPRPATAEVALWRFMVDRRFQRLGVGARALESVIEHVRSKGLFKALLVSYVPGDGSPEAFYLRAGFQHTGRVDDGEVVLTLPL
jgi:diamine N-acetyltransferase